MINQNPIITKIQNKLLEVSTLLEELSKDNSLPVPATIYRKWGLVDDSLVDQKTMMNLLLWKNGQAL